VEKNENKNVVCKKEFLEDLKERLLDFKRHSFEHQVVILSSTSVDDLERKINKCFKEFYETGCVLVDVKFTLYSEVGCDIIYFALITYKIVVRGLES